MAIAWSKPVLCRSSCGTDGWRALLQVHMAQWETAILSIPQQSLSHMYVYPFHHETSGLLVYRSQALANLCAGSLHGNTLGNPWANGTRLVRVRLFYRGLISKLSQFSCVSLKRPYATELTIVRIAFFGNCVQHRANGARRQPGCSVTGLVLECCGVGYSSGDW